MVEVVERDAASEALFEDQPLHLRGHGVRGRVQDGDFGAFATDKESRFTRTTCDFLSVRLIQKDDDCGMVASHEACVQKVRRVDLTAAESLQDLIHGGAQGKVFDRDRSEGIALICGGGAVAEAILQDPQLGGGLARGDEVVAVSVARDAAFLLRGVEDAGGAEGPVDLAVPGGCRESSAGTAGSCGRTRGACVSGQSGSRGAQD